MRIYIESAYYGANTIQAIEVTAKVQEIVDSQSASPEIDIKVDASNLGLSTVPAKDVRKSLTVTFSYAPESGSYITKSAVDFGSVTITNTMPVDIEIKSASYGTNTIMKDITTEMLEFIADPANGVTFTVGSGDFLNRFCNGHDIASGHPKTLTIKAFTFHVHDKLLAIVANDGELVDLSTLLPKKA